MMSKAELQMMASRGDRFAKQWLAEGRYAEAADEAEQQPEDGKDKQDQRVEDQKQDDSAKKPAKAEAHKQATADRAAAKPAMPDAQEIYTRRMVSTQADADGIPPAGNKAAGFPDPGEVYARRAAAMRAE
jgi:hypothetical protein